MAIVRLIPRGDIAIENDRFVILTSKAYVRQKIATRMKFFLGEWFNNRLEGVPYYRDVLGKGTDLDLAKSVFRNVITSVQEVASVPLLTLAPRKAKRELAVEFDAVLVEGGVLSVRQPDPAFIISTTNT